MEKGRLFTNLMMLGIVSALCITGCGNTSPATATTVNATNAEQTANYKWDFVKKTNGIDNLKVECDQKGTVESLDYETPLYISDENTIVTKKLYVYLPYGYDASEKYDILYLMHGGGENEAYWIAGERWGPTTRNVLDNMIKDGVCKPFIVVTPTFYPPTDENFENPEAAEDLTYVFAKELRNQVIPAVEAKYSTYAGGNVTEDNLVATRDHRGFAGFSMGSMTSIHSALMENVDLFSWIGSYSGAKTEVTDFQNALNSDKYKDYRISFWYNGNGKADIAHDEHDEFCHGVIEAMPERFTDGENFAWIDIRDGSHAYQSWLVDLYNCMLVFFDQEK